MSIAPSGRDVIQYLQKIVQMYYMQLFDVYGWRYFNTIFIIIMNLNKLKEKPSNVELVAPEVDDSELKLLQHEVPTIKLENVTTEDEFKYASLNTLDSNVSSHQTLKVLGQDCDEESDGNTFMKTEVLHEELDIKSEDDFDDDNLPPQLSEHSKILSEAKPFKCNYCGYCCNQKSTLENHVRTHTGEKPYKCNICDSCFRLKGNLEYHLKIHTGEKPYQCNDCNYRCRQKGDLRRHFRIHTGDRPFKCNICDDNFTQKRGLEAHLKTHSDEKPFICNICNSRFRRKGALTSHLRIHSAPCKCNNCNYCCGQKSDLKIDIGKKSFKCNICDSHFKLQSTFTSHLSIHTAAEKLLKCNICDCDFKRRGDLVTHLKSHSGEMSKESLKQSSNNSQ